MSDAAEYRKESRTRWGQQAKGWAARADAMGRTTMPVSVWLVDALGLQPGNDVLELAAGIGEVGFLAAEQIAPTGTLISSDFAPEMITAAQARAERMGITNVRFRQIDAEGIDQPAATLDGVLCRWGYMLMADPEAALKETRRVLKPGGRVSATYYLLNERSLEVVRSDAPTPRFRHDRGDHMVTKPDVPEMVVGYREKYVTELYGRVGLEIDPPIEYGWWARPRPARGYQDAVVAYAPK